MSNHYIPFEILVNITSYLDLHTFNNIPHKVRMFHDHFNTKWHEIPYIYCTYCNGG